MCPLSKTLGLRKALTRLPETVRKAVAAVSGNQKVDWNTITLHLKPESPMQPEEYFKKPGIHVPQVWCAGLLLRTSVRKAHPPFSEPGGFDTALRQATRGGRASQSVSDPSDDVAAKP